LDICAGGAAVLAGGSVTVEIGARVTLDFSGISGWSLSPQTGEIRWCSRESSFLGLVLIGLEFDRPVDNFMLFVSAENLD